MVITDAGFPRYVSFIIVPWPDYICIVLNAFEWAFGCISSYVIDRFDTKHKNLPASPNEKKDTNYPSEPMGVGLYTFTIKQFAKIGSDDQTQILNSFCPSWFYDNLMLKSDWTKYRNVELY